MYSLVNNVKEKVDLHNMLELAKVDYEISSNSKIILYWDCIHNKKIEVMWCEEGLSSPQRRDYIVIKNKTQQKQKESKLKMYCIFHIKIQWKDRIITNVSNHIKCREKSTKGKHAEIVMNSFPIILPTIIPPFSVYTAYS